VFLFVNADLGRKSGNVFYLGDLQGIKFVSKLNKTYN
jgi:hypothetical protein